MACGLAVCMLLFPQSSVLAGPGDTVTNWFINGILYPIVQMLANLFIIIVNILIAVAQYNDFINAVAVVKGWVIVRDLCNMFFIVFLLIIAFGTIFKLEQYRYNRLLGKLIIYAFLINFSKFIAGFWIDIGQVIMLTFVNGFKDAAAGNLASGLGMSNMLTLADNPSVGDVSGTGIYIAVLLAIALLMIAVIVVVIMTITLIFRVIMLWLLIVFSPLAFLTRVFPNTAKYSDQWWGEFNKYIMVGPVMAFFLWLSMTIISVTGADARYEFKEVSKREGSAVIGQVYGTGGGTAMNMSAAISKISESDRLLTYMITIGLLLGSLQAAQQLGVAGSKIAGDWSQKIRTGGLTAAGVLSGVAGARLAMRAARGGVKMAGGAIGRKAVEGIKIGKSMPLSYLTKEFWGGVKARGEERGQITKDWMKAKGRTRIDAFHKRFLGHLPKSSVTDYEEIFRRNLLMTNHAESEKILGSNPTTEKIVQALNAAEKTGGNEGIEDRGGRLISGVKHGNFDDWNQDKIKREIKATKKGKDKKATEEEIIRLMEQHGFDPDVEDHRHYNEETGHHMKVMLMDYLKLDREKYDPDLLAQRELKKIHPEEDWDDLLVRAYVDKEQKALAIIDPIIKKANETTRDNARKAGTEDRFKLMQLETQGELSLENGGHVEQRWGKYDEEEAFAYVMSEPEAAASSMTLLRKQGAQHVYEKSSPHSEVPRYNSLTDGEVKISTDYKNMSVLGRMKLSMAEDATERILSRTAVRIKNQTLGVEGDITNDEAVFTKFGSFYRGDKAEHERIQKEHKLKTGDDITLDEASDIREAQSRDRATALEEISPIAYQKWYRNKFHGNADRADYLVPDPKNKEEGTQEWVVKNVQMAKSSAHMGERIGAVKAEFTVPEEHKVERTEVHNKIINEATTVADESEKVSDSLPKNEEGLTNALHQVSGQMDSIANSIEDLSKSMKEPKIKEELESLAEEIKKNKQSVSNRREFYGGGEQSQKNYFRESGMLLRKLVSAVQESTVEPTSKIGEKAKGDKEDEKKPKPDSGAGPDKK